MPGTTLRMGGGGREYQLRTKVHVEEKNPHPELRGLCVVCFFVCGGGGHFNESGGGGKKTRLQNEKFGMQKTSVQDE